MFQEKRSQLAQIADFCCTVLLVAVLFSMSHQNVFAVACLVAATVLSLCWSIQSMFQNRVGPIAPVVVLCVGSLASLSITSFALSTSGPASLMSLILNSPTIGLLAGLTYILAVIAAYTGNVSRSGRYFSMIWLLLTLSILTLSAPVSRHYRVSAVLVLWVILPFLVVRLPWLPRLTTLRLLSEYDRTTGTIRPEQVSKLFPYLKGPKEWMKTGHYIARNLTEDRRPLLAYVMANVQRPSLLTVDQLEQAYEQLKTQIEEAQKGGPPASLEVLLEMKDCLEPLDDEDRSSLLRSYLESGQADTATLERHASTLAESFVSFLNGSGSYTPSQAAALWLYLKQPGVHLHSLCEDYMLTVLAALCDLGGVDDSDILTALQERVPHLPPVFAVYNKEAVFAEILNEPEVHINGATVNIWLEQAEHSLSPTRLVLCGHSVTPVCRRVTSILDNAMIDLRGSWPDCFVAGFATLDNPALGSPTLSLEGVIRQFLLPGSDPEKESPFERVIRHLHELADETGLIRIHTMAADTVKSFRDDLEAALESLSISQELIQQSSCPSEAPETPVLLPFYLLGGQDHGKEVVLRLPRAAIECPEFSKLREMYHRSRIADMRSDAEQRLITYKTWKENDEREKRHLEGMNETELQQEYTPDRVISYDWQRGERQEELARGQRATYQERLEQLVQSIKIHGKFIDSMDELLEKISQAEERQHSEGLFRRHEACLIDSFLRGWRLGFESPEMEELFAMWMGKARRSAWVFLEASLQHQRQDADSTVFGGAANGLRGQCNVWFRVESEPDRPYVLVRPMCVVDANHCQVILDPSIGISQYELPWDRRQPRQTEDPKSDAADQISKALHILDSKDAAIHLKTALALDPAGSLCHIIRKWCELLPRRSTELDFPQLVEEVRDRAQPTKCLRRWLRFRKAKMFEDAFVCIEELEMVCPGVPDVYLWRALTYADCDASTLNADEEHRRIVPKEGQSKLDFGRLAPEINATWLLRYYTSSLEKEMMDAFEQLPAIRSGHWGPAYHEAVNKNISELRHKAPDLWDSFVSDNEMLSEQLIESLVPRNLGETELVAYHTLEGLELLDLAKSMGNILRDIEDSVRRGEQWDSICQKTIGELEALAIPFFASETLFETFNHFVTHVQRRGDRIYQQLLVGQIEHFISSCYSEAVNVLSQASRSNQGYYEPILLESRALALGLRFNRALLSLFRESLLTETSSSCIDYEQGSVRDNISAEAERLRQWLLGARVSSSIILAAVYSGHDIQGVMRDALGISDELVQWEKAAHTDEQIGRAFQIYGFSIPPQNVKLS